MCEPLYFYSAAAFLAMQSAVIPTAIPSVCLSDCLSITRWYPIQMNKDRITGFSLWGSKNTLVFWHQNGRGRRPPSPKSCAQIDPPPSEKGRLRPISAYNVSTVRASKNVQLSRIGSRPGAFQRAIDEVSTLPLSPPKVGLKCKFIFLWLKIHLNRINSAIKFLYVKTSSGRVVAEPFPYPTVYICSR